MIGTATLTPSQLHGPALSAFSVDLLLYRRFRFSGLCKLYTYTRDTHARLNTLKYVLTILNHPPPPFRITLLKPFDRVARATPFDLIPGVVCGYQEETEG